MPLRLRHEFGTNALVQGSYTLKVQVHRIDLRCSLRAPGLYGNQLRSERIGEPGHDFVLHVEEIGEGLVEPFGPEVIAGFRVDQLHIDTKPAAATLDRPFEDVTD